MVADSELLAAKSVTGAARSATLRAHAQKAPQTQVTVEGATAEVSAVAVAVERLGKLGPFVHEDMLMALVQLYLWWCRTPVS